MVQNATIFKQAGYSDEDAATLSRVAALYQNVADSEVSAQEAGQFVVSQLKAYGLAASDAASIVDKLNAVSNNYSVSNSDLAIGLTKSAAALQTLGNTQDEVMGLLTAGTEQLTGQASKVGKGLQTIGINIAQVATEAGELSYEVGNTTKTISLLDEATGDMRSTFDVLSDIAQDWNNMTDAQQTAISNALAGKTRFDVFAAVMTRFDDAISATTTSMNSFGSAEEENAKYMESMSAKISLLKQQFQELVLGDGGLQSFGKGLLDVGISILKFANSDIGQAIIQTALWIVGINGAVKALGLLKGSQIVNWITTFITAMTAAKDSTIGFVGALELANINPMVLAITALVAVVVAAKTAYDHWNVTLDEHVEKLKELKSDYEEAQNKADSLEQQLENVRDRIEEINSKDNLEITDETQLRMLQEEEASLENQLLIQKELARVAKEEATDEAKKTLQKKFKDEAAFGTTTVSSGGIDVQAVNEGTTTEALDIYVKRLNETQDEIDSLLAKRAELEKSNQKESEEYKQINADIEALRTKKEALRTTTSNYAETVLLATQGVNEEDEVIQSATSSLTSYTETLQRLDGEDTSENVDKTADAIQKTGDAADDGNEDLGETDDYLKELAKQAGVSEEELTSLAESLNASVESVAEWLSGANDFSDSLSDLSSAYETLKEAADEYNSTGTYSAETMSKLLSMSPDLVASLQEENGQLVVNEAVLQNAANAMIDEAEATLLTKAQMEVANIMAGTFDETLVGVGNDAITTGTNVATAGQQALQSGMDANAGAEGWLNFWSAATEGQGTVNDAKTAEAMARAEDSYKKQYEALEELRGKVGQYGKASASAHSKSAKATDKEKSAVDQLKDKYKTVIDFILKQYDKQIDKIKETKDAAIKSVESQIKALEKEKDSKVKAIDAEITSLQRQRDAREKYWQDQLDKLEKENNERERNIALQEKQQALALAQQSQVMVLQDGQFQYTQDESAVAGAEQDLAQQEDQNEYERQKELIEELRDTELEWYDERIQALEDYKEQVEEYYEEQIEQLEEYKEYLEEYYEAQIEALEAEKEAVNATLEEGAANQQEYWDKMKEQLQAFVEEWNSLVGSMTFPNISGSGISLSAVGSKISASMGGKSTGDNKVSAYASGKGSIGDSEIAVVGENPKYRELVIGSKLNNDQGVVMSLKRSSGVVNAGATNTLASIFNSLNGQKSVGQPVSNSNQSMSIQIGSISLPEVKDGQGFVDYLQNFSADITQQSFRRA